MFYMLFGAHVSTSGGIENAPENAHEIGAAVFQFFDRSPRGGKPTYTDKSVAEFKANMAKYKIQECYIHTPYYINLASAENRIRFGSISVIREELESASRLGARYVMTHLGSAKDFTDQEALALVVDGINKILNGYTGTAELLIENSSGAGQIIGDTFEEIGSHKDRHADIGYGFIKEQAFAAIAGSSALKNINAVLETPEEEINYKQTIQLLKKLL